MDKERNHFRALYCSQMDVKTIEAQFENDPRIQELSQKILTAKDQMSAIVGSGISLWLNLEELINERETILEEMYFNTGFEHGNRRGMAEALKLFAPSDANRYRMLSEKIQSLLVGIGLPDRQIIAALVENAWALALGYEFDSV